MYVFLGLGKDRLNLLSFNIHTGTESIWPPWSRILGAEAFDIFPLAGAGATKLLTGQPGVFLEAGLWWSRLGGAEAFVIFPLSAVGATDFFTGQLRVFFEAGLGVLFRRRSWMSAALRLHAGYAKYVKNSLGTPKKQVDTSDVPSTFWHPNVPQNRVGTSDVPTCFWVP